LHLSRLKPSYPSLANYGERYHNGQRIFNASNQLIDKRISKSQQMRWSDYGAHQQLQVRTVMVNGEFDRLFFAHEGLAAAR